MKRMVEKGNKMLEQELDLMDMIKKSKHHHKLLKDHPNHKKEVKDQLHIDEELVESGSESYDH